MKVNCFRCLPAQSFHCEEIDQDNMYVVNGKEGLKIKGNIETCQKRMRDMCRHVIIYASNPNHFLRTPEIGS